MGAVTLLRTSVGTLLRLALVAGLAAGLAAPVTAQLTNPDAPNYPTDPKTQFETQPSLEQELTMPVKPLRFAVRPPYGVPMLANLPACTTRTGYNQYTFTAPPGASCLRSYAAEPGAAPADGRIPPAEWLVETSGGYAPVRVSIAVPQAPELAGLFSLAVPPPATLGGQPTLVQNEALASFEAAYSIGQASPPIRRIIRFAGMPYDLAGRKEIIVNLIARDYRGAVVQTDFRLYPYSPRIKSVATNAGGAPLVAYRHLGLGLEIAGLGAASKVRPVGHPGTVFATEHCHWDETGSMLGAGTRPDTTPLDVPPNPNSLWLNRVGGFAAEPRVGGGRACRMALEFEYQFPRGNLDGTQNNPRILHTAPTTVTLEPRVAYRYAQTHALRAHWNWFPANEHGMETKIGNCSGESTGPSGTFKVGPQSHDGDLSFRIRSGPAGTHCRYFDVRAQSIHLRSGVMLDSASWSYKLVGDKCRVVKRDDPVASGGPFLSFSFSRGGSTPWTIPPEPLAAVTGFADPLLDPTTKVTLATGGSGRTYRAVLKPVVAELKCEPTAINDHEVRLTLDEVAFSGPPGLSGP
jgi:hypothetical protein